MQLDAITIIVIIIIVIIIIIIIISAQFQQPLRTLSKRIDLVRRSAPIARFLGGAGKKLGLFRKKVFTFYVLRSDTNYYPEIHEEYLIHDTPFLLPHHL